MKSSRTSGRKAGIDVNCCGFGSRSSWKAFSQFVAFRILLIIVGIASAAQTATHCLMMFSNSERSAALLCEAEAICCRKFVNVQSRSAVRPASHLPPSLMSISSFLAGTAIEASGGADVSGIPLSSRDCRSPGTGASAPLWGCCTFCWLRRLLAIFARFVGGLGRVFGILLGDDECSFLPPRGLGNEHGGHYVELQLAGLLNVRKFFRPFVSPVVHRCFEHCRFFQVASGLFRPVLALVACVVVAVR